MENYYPKNNYFKLPLEKIMKKMMNSNIEAKQTNE